MMSPLADAGHTMAPSRRNGNAMEPSSVRAFVKAEKSLPSAASDNAFAWPDKSGAIKMDVVTYTLFSIIFVFLLILILGSFFTVDTAQIVVVTRPAMVSMIGHFQFKPGA